MEKKYVLTVEYGTGKISMLTATNDIVEALKEFLNEYSKALPDTKMYGLPTIIKAEITVLKYNSNYKGN